MSLLIVKNAISEFLSEINNNIDIETSLCSCDAVTMSSSDSNSQISFMHKNAPYVGITLTDVLDNCDHCINNWGVDIVDNSEQIAEIEQQIEELEERIADLNDRAINVCLAKDLRNRIMILGNNLEALEN